MFFYVILHKISGSVRKDPLAIVTRGEDITPVQINTSRFLIARPSIIPNFILIVIYNIIIYFIANTSISTHMIKGLEPYT